MTKGVLFDLDGTLLDTARDLGGALNVMLNRYNLPEVEYERYRIEASNGSIGLLKLGFADVYNDYQESDLRQEFLDIYHHNICKDTSVFPGIEEIISYLDEQGIPWGIVTNKPEDLTKQLLPFFPVMNSSGVVVAGDTLPERKPSPVPLLHAAEIIGCAPEACIYVGDALRDIEAANQANMISVLAGYGYLSQSQIAELTKIANKTCNSVPELKSFLTEI
ncbi:MAG: HAD family hydrolase [Aestuariibacter sp.]